MEKYGAFLGSFVGLTSKRDIKYEGVLDRADISKVLLKDVRLVGRETSSNDVLAIPASKAVYGYIVFREVDIKEFNVKHFPCGDYLGKANIHLRHSEDDVIKASSSGTQFFQNDKSASSMPTFPSVETKRPTNLLHEWRHCANIPVVPSSFLWQGHTSWWSWVCPSSISTIANISFQPPIVSGYAMPCTSLSLPPRTWKPSVTFSGTSSMVYKQPLLPLPVSLAQHKRFMKEKKKYGKIFASQYQTSVERGSQNKTKGEICDTKQYQTSVERGSQNKTKGEICGTKPWKPNLGMCSNVEAGKDFDFEAMNKQFNKRELWAEIKLQEEEALHGCIEENSSVTEENRNKSQLYVDNFFDLFSSQDTDCKEKDLEQSYAEQLKIDTETFGSFPSSYQNAERYKKHGHHKRDT